jgi:hypothetical protein
MLNQSDDVDTRSQEANIEMELIYGRGIPVGILSMHGTPNYREICKLRYLFVIFYIIIYTSYDILNFFLVHVS